MNGEPRDTKSGTRHRAAHLQSRRRTLRPMSDVHLRGQPGTERRQTASFWRWCPRMGSTVSTCTLVLDLFSDSDTSRLTAAAAPPIEGGVGKGKKKKKKKKYPVQLSKSKPSGRE